LHAARQDLICARPQDARQTNPNTQQFSTWIKDHRIGEVECLVPDINGVLRGKVAGRKIRLQP
jgi:hypothetical protein